MPAKYISQFPFKKVFGSAVSILYMAAPSMTGMLKRKEKLKASFFGIPHSKDVDIVVPDLDIPGIRARAWAKPIRMDRKKSIFSEPVFRFTRKENSADIRNAAVMKNMYPTRDGLLKKESKKSSRKNPANTAGIVPVIRNPISL